MEGFTREVYFLGLPCRNRPAEFARTSLSACGLPTPVVALACIGNVDIQVFSCADGRLYFIRRLQVYLFIIFHVQPISQGVTLLFFFAEKKKRSKKRKEFAYPCTVWQCITRRLYKRFSPTKIPRRGKQAAAAAVTLPFSQLKLGRRVSGDSPQSPGGAYRRLPPP
ncbi:hypothetical protein [Ruminococcus callidus]|uniref:hypothetical protein n=1 Tax=Ruminococcus callidus TaxID=40519 RepID=UPI0023F78611|nr:hypothetical protein [Ruminococcus callidus]